MDAIDTLIAYLWDMGLIQEEISQDLEIEDADVAESLHRQNLDHDGS